MSAKHKRPFYVFAAVAAVCCLVLVTGVRGSKADDGRSPVVAGDSRVVDTGGTLAPIPDLPGAPVPDPATGATGGSDPSWEGGVEITTPSLDEPVTGADGEDAESGLIVLPPFDLPPPLVVDPGEVTPPVTDDTDGKGRGERGGKKGKGKDKDKDKDDENSEPDAESEDEDEVDPDVYGLPEGDVGDSEGDQAAGPVDPEVTP